MARLAVDRCEARQGLGKAMLADAMKRAAKAARIVGARALLVHALSDDAVAFYERFQFRRFNEASRTLFLAMKTIQDGMGR